jgi:hypothetical protein
MSALIVSALAAAALAAVPPSIGSEPVPVNFDYVAGPTQHFALEGPSLTASLGSEPNFADAGAAVSPVATKPGVRPSTLSTLAASLGSEPFIIGFDESAPRTPVLERRPSDELVAHNCTCK